MPAIPKTEPLAGWVCFRIYAWQRIVSGRAEWLVQMDLEDYLAAVGDAAIESLILPDGERP